MRKLEKLSKRLSAHKNQKRREKIDRRSEERARPKVVEKK